MRGYCVKRQWAEVEEVCDMLLLETSEVLLGIAIWAGKNALNLLSGKDTALF